MQTIVKNIALDNVTYNYLITVMISKSLATYVCSFVHMYLEGGLAGLELKIILLSCIRSYCSLEKYNFMRKLFMVKISSWIPTYVRT